MEAILMSIKPKYCELIANGKKTVEVRKTKPKIDVPFKCYIYCTKAKDYFSIGGGVYVANDELYKLPTGEIKFGDSFELMGDWRGQYDETNFLNGKVIGEFVCEKMSKFDSIDYITPEMVSIGMASCLTEKEFVDYVGNNFAYGWHITDLVIYNKPKELWNFKKECNSRNCEKCEYLDVDRFDDDYITRCEVEGKKPITRPPQSYQFVCELIEEKQYFYGMRLRGFSIGCQPMNGLIKRVDDASGRYHDMLIYSRQLTKQECQDYELDYLGEDDFWGV